MPRVSTGKDGTLTIRVIVSELEYPALFRDLMNIGSGGKRRARLFGLAQMGLALEMANAAPTSVAPTRVSRAAVREDRLTTSELADLFGDTPIPDAEQGA